MKKVVLSFLILVLLGCRNEDFIFKDNVSDDENRKKYFQVFGQKHHSNINYGQSFSWLFARYDSIQNDKQDSLNFITYNKFNNKEFIDFSLVSQSFINDNNDIWVAYPIVFNNKVKDIAIVILQNERTAINIKRLSSDAKNYQETLNVFQVAYNKKIRKSVLHKSQYNKYYQCEIGCNYKRIEEVEIIKIKEPPQFKVPDDDIGGGGFYPKFPKYCGDFMNCQSLPNFGGIGIPIQEPPTPCENNKKIASNSVVNAKNNDLKEKLKDIKKNKVKEKDIFEDGYTFDRYSNGDINPNVRENRQEGQSSMTVSIKSNTVGYNHTHPKGVKMFSPRDINSFLNLIRNAKKNNIPYNELFATVVFERDGKYSVYQMTYTGDGSDLPAEFTEEQLKIITDKYAKDAKKYLEYGEGQMYIDDGYRLFLDTLKNMGVKNVQLSDVSNPQNPIIVEDNKGRPKKVNCK